MPLFAANLSHEPDVGELNCGYLFDIIDSLGLDGSIGCE